MYSNIMLFNGNKLSDYYIEKLTGMRLNRKFSVIISFKGGMKRLVEYLTKFLSFNDDFFDIFVAIDETGYDIKRLGNLFANVSVIQFMKSQSFSSKMRTFVSVVKSEYFLLINENFKLVKFDFKFLDKLFASYKKPICISPLIMNRDFDIIPSIRIPGKNARTNLEVGYSFPVSSIQNTLYPISGVGVYNRELLLFSGGFSDIADYYSILEFFAKQWCCGFSCTFSDCLQLVCQDEDELVENIDLSSMADVNLNVFASKKEGEAFAKINPSSLLFFDYKDVKKANEKNKNFLYDYNMIVKNWVLYEDECASVLKRDKT